VTNDPAGRERNPKEFQNLKPELSTSPVGQGLMDIGSLRISDFELLAGFGSRPSDISILMDAKLTETIAKKRRLSIRTLGVLMPYVIKAEFTQMPFDEFNFCANV
jgi:hypothetical protein